MMEYELGSIGLAPFRRLATELVAELTGHFLEPATDSSGLRSSPEATPVNLRWPEFLGGETWSGVALLDCLFVPESDRNSWTVDRLRSYIRDKVLHESAARENADKRLQALEANPKIDAEQLEAERQGSTLGLPQYVVFASNLPRPVVEKLNSESTRSRLFGLAGQLGLRGWKLWDQTTFWQMLDAAKVSRRKYLAELAPVDIIDQVKNYNVGVPERLQELLKLQMINELKAEQWIHLSQVGNSELTKLDLYRVGIDLPVKDESRNAARIIIEAADAASPFRRTDSAGNALLLGGPGQGKSTIAQLIGQCYRVSLLEGALKPDHPT